MSASIPVSGSRPVKISIALCTFNGAKYLSDQLASIAKQTRLPDELIVCDDASTDDTRLLLEEFRSNAPFRVELHRNSENLGSFRNFESAISKCCGDIIALADQDDYWLPQKLKVIESAFTAHPEVGLVFSDAVLVDEHLRPLHTRLWRFTFPRKDRKRFRRDEAFDVLLEHNVVTGATMAFRSELCKVIMPFPLLPGFIHDGWISLAAAVYADLFFVNEPLIMYRQHSKQELGLSFFRSSTTFRDRHRGYIEHNLHLIQSLDELRCLIGSGMVLGQTEVCRPSLSKEEMRSKVALAQRFVMQRIKHYEKRMALPDAKVKRILPIVRELATFGYHDYSKGFLSAIVDLTSE